MNQQAIMGLIDRFNDLRGHIKNIEDEQLRDFCNAVYDDPEVYCTLPFHPAAKGNHQNWSGGLVLHISNLIKLCTHASEMYPALNGDMLVAACLLHDIGKLQEIEVRENGEFRYTSRGKAVGHITLGLMFLEKFRFHLTETKWDHLCHIIVSHHGRYEWGSPKLPMTREALAFHQMDYLDARLGTLDIIEREGVMNGTMTFDGYVMNGNSNLPNAWFPKTN